ncbi:MAG: RNA polymerase sigma factor [Bacteroidaceae bacterium]|nr:RNA polymerase sigma factor [Bacteroidaceae bacterium]
MNRETFIACVEREQEALRGFLLALCCGNRDEADDLAQDALVKAYLACSGFRDGGKFRSWLFKIAHNTFLSHKRSQETHPQPLPLWRGEEVQAEDEREHHQDLYLALSMLPPKERSSITLFYLNGYNIKEIAAITEVSQDAVKQQLSRGREKLRAILKIEN